MSKRASVFEDDEPADLDLSVFQPKQPAEEPIAAEQVRAIAEASNFPSREAKKEKAPTPEQPPAPKVASAKRAAHRLRTGRTLQINARASAETVEEFYAIAAAQNWKAAETLERAVAALKRELDRK